MVIYRLPRQISIVRPGSHCPRCDAPVAWYDNVPLVSYIVLRGRCRRCGMGITPRYFTVELLTAALWVICGIEFELTWALAPALLLVTALVPIFYIDLDHYIIPNVIVLPVAAAGLALSIFISLTGDQAAAGWQPWYAYVIAGLGSGVFFFVVALLKPGGMGMGDVKLATMLGFFLGKDVVIALFLGFLFGALTGVLLMSMGIKGRKSQIPFGPFLAAGAVVALFYGDRLLQLWTGLFQK